MTILLLTSLIICMGLVFTDLICLFKEAPYLIAGILSPADLGLGILGVSLLLIYFLSNKEKRMGNYWYGDIVGSVCVFSLLLNFVELGKIPALFIRFFVIVIFAVLLIQKYRGLKSS